MKAIILFLAMIFVIVLTLITYGQTVNDMNTKTVVKENDISNVLEKPDYESTVDSLNTKVWIISQKKYKELMKTQVGKSMDNMKVDNTQMDKTTKEAMIDGTHYFIFDVTNITTEKEVADTSAKVEIVSPSKIISSVNLQPMMNHFGGGVSLTEKGEYLFTINLNIGSGYTTSQFKYNIK